VNERNDLDYFGLEAVDQPMSAEQQLSHGHVADFGDDSTPRSELAQRSCCISGVANERRRVENGRFGDEFRGVF
jgi:hypothetical protein